LRKKYIAAGGKVGENEHVDHVRDLQLGGTNVPANLKPPSSSKP